jgi:hypothetical protein
MDECAAIHCANSANPARNEPGGSGCVGQSSYVAAGQWDAAEVLKVRTESLSCRMILVVDDSWDGAKVHATCESMCTCDESSA